MGGLRARRRVDAARLQRDEVLSYAHISFPARQLVLIKDNMGIFHPDVYM